MTMKYYTAISAVLTTLIVIALIVAVLLGQNGSQEPIGYSDGVIHPILDSQVVVEGADESVQTVSIQEGVQQVVTVE